MEEVGEQHQPEDRRTSALEDVTRGGTILLAGSYGLGFIIVGIHHGQYGIPQVGLLRPRVFAAGVLFLLLTGIPAIIAARTFAFFGLRKRFGNPVAASEGNRALRDVLLLLGLFFTSYWLASGLSRSLVGAIREPGLAGQIMSSIWGMIWISSGSAWVSKFDEHPKMSLFLGALLFVALQVIVFLYLDARVVAIYLWLSGSGLVSYFAYRLIRVTGWKEVEWEWHLAIALPALILFALFVYGDVKPEWGGGAPAPVVLHLGQRIGPNGPTLIAALLLEETDQGYYLLRRPQAKSAFFVRREQVFSVDFTGW